MVEAQEVFLAPQHNTAFGTPELHPFLFAQGFRLTRSDCSKLLARRESRGVLDRAGWAQYQVL